MSDAIMLFTIAGSGGVGKSSAARALAQTAGHAGLRVTLVDGNPGQQSQRSYLDAGDTYGLEHAFDAGLPGALAGPRAINAAYAFLAGPLDPYASDVNDMYAEALTKLRRVCDLIIIDADRTDPSQWNNPRTFSGSIVRPMVEQTGARLVFRIGQSSSQIDDGLAALDAIRLPDSTGIITVTPVGVKPLSERRWKPMIDGMGRLLGNDRWDRTSMQLLDRKMRGWPVGREPDWVDATLEWAGVHGIHRRTKETTKKRRQRGGRHA